MSESEKKTFVLDTNVHFHDADSLFSFGDNNIVIPMEVIEEIDNHKHRADELGYNARKTVRDLDKLRELGSLARGVEMETGGILKIAPRHLIDRELKRLKLKEKPDNYIIATAYCLMKQNKNVVFVTKDLNARIKADSLGIRVADYDKEKVDTDSLYNGCLEVPVGKSVLDQFRQEKGLDVSVLELNNVYPNMFIILVNENNNHDKSTGRIVGDQLIPLESRFEKASSITPRNCEQRLALELLFDPQIKLVTLVGQAGSGKTLLALAAALEQRTAEGYKKILVSRPVIPMGKDIGYLPGSKDEKMSNWIQPIKDNLEFIASSQKEEKRRNQDKSESVDESKKAKKQSSNKNSKVGKWFSSHTIEIEALTYIRGRSIPGQYVIVDEAQNLTPHEVKTIISRAGEGTKMILTGDPYQIDNPYLDKNSNGLAVAVEKCKNQPLSGHITLQASERSDLAAMIVDCM